MLKLHPLSLLALPFACLQNFDLTACWFEFKSLMEGKETITVSNSQTNNYVVLEEEEFPRLFKPNLNLS